MHIVYGLVFDDRKERVLMVRNDLERGWSLPGGVQDPVHGARRDSCGGP